IVLLIHRYDEGHLIPPRLSTVQTDRPVSSRNCGTRTTREYVVGRKAVLPDHPTHVTQPVRRKEEPLGTFLEVELCTSIRTSRISQAAQRGVLTPGCTLRTCIQFRLCPKRIERREPRTTLAGIERSLCLYQPGLHPGGHRYRTLTRGILHLLKPQCCLTLPHSLRTSRCYEVWNSGVTVVEGCSIGNTLIVGYRPATEVVPPVPYSIVLRRSIRGMLDQVLELHGHICHSGSGL